MKFYRVGVVRLPKLDEGGEFRGLYIEHGDPPNCKKGSVKICNSQSRDPNYVWHNFWQIIKSVLFEKVAILNWGGNADFKVQPRNW